MKTIVPPDANVAHILGKQKKRENETYRLLAYCAQCPIKNGLLLYNTLTLELLLLSPQEADKLMEQDELIEKWFLVPKGQDDQVLADQVREIAFLLAHIPGQVTAYTIFTTTNCNARCYYCFEREVARKHMTLDTAHRLARWIMEHSGGQEVKLNWFGGEPLVNQRVIDCICVELKENGRAYRSSIISNGYLFDEETVQKAVSCWRLETAQITLDGTEEAYNRIKAYVAPSGSPFRRVLHNIGLLLDAGVRVDIRLNISLENGEDMLQLAEQLAARFQGKQGLSVYAHPLFEETVSEDGKHQVHGTRSTLLRQKSGVVQERLLQLGLRFPQRLPRAARLNHCMADLDASVTVTPDGFLGRCEHFAESELFGHIDSEERDEAMLASWKETEPARPECAHCILYPQCRILKKCPGKIICTLTDDTDIQNRLRRRMRYEYECFLKSQPPEEETALSPENC